MSKKNIFFLICITICILGISVPAMAETTSRRANIKSSGNLDFKDGTVYFTSSDLTYLADEIDNLEDTYKQTSVDALNDIGTFFLHDGTVVRDVAQNEVDTDEKKSALSFGNILEGIKSSQSIDSLAQTQVTDKDGNLLFYETEEAQTNKDIHSLTTTDTGLAAFYQPANADNLSAGTAAWVDGNLIKGNGSDNAAYEELGKLNASPTIISLLIHTCMQVNTELYISNSVVDNWSGNGIKIVQNTNSFDFQGTNQFVCQKNGTVFLIGDAALSSSSTATKCSVFVYKNGIKQTVSVNNSKFNYNFEVEEGDVLNFSVACNEAWWWTGNIALIF